MISVYCIHKSCRCESVWTHPSENKTVRRHKEKHGGAQYGLRETTDCPNRCLVISKQTTWGRFVYKRMKEKGNLGDGEREIQFDCNLMYTFYCLWVKLDFRFVFAVPPFSPFTVLGRRIYLERSMVVSDWRIMLWGWWTDGNLSKRQQTV